MQTSRLASQVDFNIGNFGNVGNEDYYWEDLSYDGPHRPVCEDPGFTGELLETPRKIVILMPFGFEVAKNKITI